jgi:hypothetical protein
MSTTDYQAVQGTSTPLPWRPYRDTKLHHQLGKRSYRFYYPAAANIPVTGTAFGTLNFRYGPEVSMDRVIGMYLACLNPTVNASFGIQDLYSNWIGSRVFTAGYGSVTYLNVETMPDSANLQWSFSVWPGAPVYLTFYNFEVIPFISQF